MTADSGQQLELIEDEQHQRRRERAADDERANREPLSLEEIRRAFNAEIFSASRSS